MPPRGKSARGGVGKEDETKPLKEAAAKKKAASKIESAISKKLIEGIENEPEMNKSVSPKPDVAQQNCSRSSFSIYSDSAASSDKGRPISHLHHRCSHFCFGYLHSLQLFLVLLWLVIFLLWVFLFNENGKGFGKNGISFFQWHPLLMTFSYALFMGESIIVYRNASSDHYKKKFYHYILSLFSLFSMLVGYIIVWGYHRMIKAPHFYSVHSWVGFLAILLSLFQFLVGTIFYGIPNLVSIKIKAQFLPIHRFLGQFCYIIGIIAIVSGLMDRQGFIRLDPPHGVGKLGHSCLFANILAILTLLAGGLNLYQCKEKIT